MIESAGFANGHCDRKRNKEEKRSMLAYGAFERIDSIGR